MCFPHFRLFSPYRLEAINTHVTGTYCLPLAACIFYSVTAQGRLSEEFELRGELGNIPDGGRPVEMEER